MTETIAPSKEEIPFSVLQQIVSGFRIDGEIKTDLSKEQIEAMKKAQQSQYSSSGDLNKLSSLMFASSGKNRRFNEALATLKAENETELHREWLSLITPEQQASIRRKNRQAMLQASLQRQPSVQALLSGDESLDVLMTNNDFLSVIERPAVQDILELTDEQVKAIEAILSRRVPQMEVKFPSPGGDFQKESEEFHKSAREQSELIQEHFNKQNQDIKDLLSETQRSRFTEMTGHQFPNGPTI